MSQAEGDSRPFVLPAMRWMRCLLNSGDIAFLGLFFPAACWTGRGCKFEVTGGFEGVGVDKATTCVAVS